MAPGNLKHVIFSFVLIIFLSNAFKLFNETMKFKVKSPIILSNRGIDYICLPLASQTEKAIAPHSSPLAWKIPWMEAWKAAVHGVAEGQTRLSDFTFTFHFHALEKEMATHSSVLAWRIPGTAEPGRLPSMGSHRVGHNWSDLAAAAASPNYDLVVYQNELNSLDISLVKWQ